MAVEPRRVVALRHVAVLAKVRESLEERFLISSVAGVCGVSQSEPAVRIKTDQIVEAVLHHAPIEGCLFGGYIVAIDQVDL